MTIVRKILAAAAIAGTLAVLPMSGIAGTSQVAGGNFGSGGMTTNGGQGGWPLKV